MSELHIDQDAELMAIGRITTALNPLNDEQRRNVLSYIWTRYVEHIGMKMPVGDRTSDATQQETMPQSGAAFDTLGDFFDQANPTTEAERVLVVAEWMRRKEQIDEFDSFSINKRLRDLGHPISNITRAIDSLTSQQPRGVIQTGKSGSSQQARKTFKVTREGTKRVDAMLNRQ